MRRVGCVLLGFALLYIALAGLGLSCEECTVGEAPWPARAEAVIAGVAFAATLATGVMPGPRSKAFARAAVASWASWAAFVALWLAGVFA